MTWPPLAVSATLLHVTVGISEGRVRGRLLEVATLLHVTVGISEGLPMRVVVVVLVLLTSGSGPAAAGDARERAYERQQRHVEAYYGPRVKLPGVTRQVVVDRGPRLLIEEDFFGLFEPAYTSRRLPSRVRSVPVEAEHPWYRAPEAYERDERRRTGRRPSKG